MKITRRQAAAGILSTGLLQVRAATTRSIKAMKPQPGGIQFVMYADSTSGRPDGPNALDLAALNRLILRLSPAPEFIVFPGDHIGGSENLEEHRRQWRYFLDTEMAPITAAKIPVYNTTSNHDNYYPGTDQIFREVLPDIPKNGPAGEEGLEYWVRRGDVLLVAVNMHSSRRGSWGRIDAAWLDKVLTENHDAKYKLVTAHLPAHTVNGYGFMNCNHEDSLKFWDLLVKHGVQIYLCSHVLAFDVQVHRGVMQIATGCASGKGGGGLMPDNTEYVHFVQVALGDDGVRFQTIDMASSVREWGVWPVKESPGRYAVDNTSAKLSEQLRSGPTVGETWYVIWRFSGVVPQPADHPQTLLAGFMGLSIVFEEASMRLAVNLTPERDRSWERWTGPKFEPGQRFSFEIMMYSALGPGGLLFRQTGEKIWNSMDTKSARGLEKFSWPGLWWVGRGQDGDYHDVWSGDLPKVEWSYPRTVSREEAFGA
jgi:calcineurin-like phosphoesterase family protein